MHNVIKPKPAVGEQGQAKNQLWQSIEDCSLLKTTQLQSEIPHLLTGTLLTSSHATNDKEGINQMLVGVVGAGDETFGLVRLLDTAAKIGDKDPRAYLVTRMYPYETDKRPTIVGIVTPGSPLTVGRSKDPSYASDVSRDHFSVDIGIDGKPAVTDLDTTFGTTLVEPADLTQEELGAYVESEHKISSGGLRKRIAALRNIKRPTLNIENPLDDYAIWSAKSAAARMAADSLKPQG